MGICGQVHIAAGGGGMGNVPQICTEPKVSGDVPGVAPAPNVQIGL